MKFRVVLLGMMLALGFPAWAQPVRPYRSAIAATAPVYGYDLAAGNWSVQQLACPAMSETILLRYVRKFPDRSTSMFTALVPRRSGRVELVPILYAGRTPFTPAANNLRNVAVFNRMVSAARVRRDLASPRGWQELGACYAYMTGSNALAVRAGSIGMAEAPTPVLHIEKQSRSATITFADRTGIGTYRLWSLRFNTRGRMVAASVRTYAVSTAKPAPQAISARKSEEAHASSAVPVRPPEVVSRLGAGRRARSQGGEVGWKFVPEAEQPSGKFVPDGPVPDARVIPDPSAD